MHCGHDGDHGQEMALRFALVEKAMRSMGAPISDEEASAIGSLESIPIPRNASEQSIEEAVAIAAARALCAVLVENAKNALVASPILPHPQTSQTPKLSSSSSSSSSPSSSPSSATLRSAAVESASSMFRTLPASPSAQYPSSSPFFSSRRSSTPDYPFLISYPPQPPLSAPSSSSSSSSSSSFHSLSLSPNTPRVIPIIRRFENDSAHTRMKRHSLPLLSSHHPSLSAPFTTPLPPRPPPLQPPPRSSPPRAGPESNLIEADSTTTSGRFQRHVHKPVHPMYIPGLQVSWVDKMPDESGLSAGRMPGVDGMPGESGSSADFAAMDHGQSAAKQPRRRPTAVCCDMGSPRYSRATLPLLPPPSPLPDSPPSLRDIASLHGLDEADPMLAQRPMAWELPEADPMLAQRPMAWELPEASVMLIQRADELIKSGAGRIRCRERDAVPSRLDVAPGPTLGHGAVRTHGRFLCHGLEAVAV